MSASIHGAVITIEKLKNELHFATDYNSDILQIYLFYFIYMCRYLSVSMYIHKGQKRA